MEYPSYSGNLNIQLSDHLCQFGILKAIKEILITLKKVNSLKHNNSDWPSILSSAKNDPNILINNMHLHVSNLLDSFALFKKLTKN